MSLRDWLKPAWELTLGLGKEFQILTILHAKKFWRTLLVHRVLYSLLLLIVLRRMFLLHWNRKLLYETWLFTIVGYIWRKPVLTYAIGVVIYWCWWQWWIWCRNIMWPITNFHFKALNIHCFPRAFVYKQSRLLKIFLHKCLNLDGINLLTNFYPRLKFAFDGLRCQSWTTQTWLEGRWYQISVKCALIV